MGIYTPVFTVSQVAVHPRAWTSGHSTDAQHMAKAHRKHQEWSPQWFLNWAQDMGPHTQGLIRYQLESRAHPEHGYRACLGLLSLSKKYGKECLEAACHRATHIGGMHYKNVASILASSMDKVPLEPLDTTTQKELPLAHENVRGNDYYH